MTYAQKEVVSGWYIAATVAVVGALLINSIATDTNGIDSTDHRANLPAGVAQLSGQAHLINDGSRVKPEDLCFGDSSDTNDLTVNESRPVEEIDATFVECDKPQAWNVTAKDSPNFGESILSTLSNPWYLASTGIAFLLVSIYPFVLFMGSLGDRRQAKREKKQNLITLEYRRRELRASWARDEIDDVTFDTKLGELLAQGLPPEK